MRLGWIPDPPDRRDHGLERLALTFPAKLPASCDLTDGCTPVKDQGDLGSCTANAAISLVEYCDRANVRNWMAQSRLFTYRTTRELMGESGDSGATLRDTMRSLALFGSPPEEFWPYEVTDFDVEPSAFAYAMAGNYRGLEYMKLDKPGTDPVTVGKTALAAGQPFVFGFVVFASMQDSDGDVLWTPGEPISGGHAVVAVGYDDERRIGQQTGAFKFKNSWGPAWGFSGYGWLPYAYFTEGCAQDCWTLTKAEYLDQKVFE